MFVVSLEIPETLITEVPGTIKELRDMIPEVNFETLMPVAIIGNGLVSITAVDKIREYLRGYVRCKVWVFPLDGIIHLGITI